MFKRIVCIVFVLLFTTACNTTHDFTHPKIVRPVNTNNPLYGVWEVREIISNELQTEDNQSLMIGEKVEFSPEHLLFKETVLSQPVYKIKRVDLREYILYNQTDFLLSYVNKTEVEIITILDEDFFYGEVFLLDTEEIILKISRQTYYLEKVCDNWTEDLGGIKNNTTGIENIYSSNEGTPTGVLLGLKQNHENIYSYRTLWISDKDGDIEFIEIDEILFPRRSGFWKLKTKDNQIYSTSTTNEELTTLIPLSQKNSEKEKVIHYVGNDYISLEEKYLENDELHSTFKIVPVDSLPKITGVSIEDLLGTSGQIALKNSKEMAISKIKQSLDNTVLKKNQDNFGLTRNMGQWVLMGNIAYKQNETLLTEAYKINILPPEELVKYNLFHLSWSHVKDRIPTATDAFTSPTKNIAVITTPAELYVYEIINNMLSKEPLATTKLQRGETVIMAEWATGLYVSSWDQEVKRHKEQEK